MKTHFLDIFEGLKRSLWKIKLKFETVSQYDDVDKKIDTEIFMHSINEKTIILEESHSNADDIIKSLLKESKDINKQIERSRFNL